MKKVTKNNHVAVWNSGFTLVELLLASTIAVTVGVIGVGGYVQFTNKQHLQNSAKDVALMLQKARSRSLTQVKPSTVTACSTNPLVGYEMRVCGISGSACTGADTYELYIVCGANYSLMESKQLSGEVMFANSTRTRFLFQVLSGASQAGIINISGYGESKQIQVSSTGNVTVQ